MILTRTRIGALVTAIGIAVALSACQSTGSHSSGSDGPTVVSVTTTAPVAIPVGVTEQLQANVFYSDGTGGPADSGVTWTSSDPAVASVDVGGQVTAVAPGTATIRATVSEVTSNTPALEVTAAAISSLSLTVDAPSLAAGLGAQLAVTGNYDDGTSVAITSGVTFSSDDTGVATVDAAGAVTGVAAGSATVTASFAGKSDTQTVTVTSAVLQSLSVQAGLPSIAAGLDTQLQVFAAFSDGSSVDVTGSATFSADAGGLTSVSAAGLVTGLAAGTATVAAHYGGLNATVPVTVSAAILQSLTLQLGQSSIIAGLGTTLSLFGNYSDGTSAEIASGATFSSDTLGVATATSLGIVTGVAAGTATLSASYGGLSTSVDVTVTAPVLQSLSLSVTAGSLAAGLTSQITVTGHYDDGSSIVLSSGVSFSSDNLLAATVNGSGLVTAVATGSATITASYSGQSATQSIGVTSATLTSISVSAASGSLAAGLTTQITVTGHYSDASTATISSGVTFSSDNALLATVTNAGWVSTLATGTVNITASYGGFSDSAPVTVTNATLTSITIAPGSATLLLGISTSITVTGHYTDASTATISSGATFSSSNNSLLSVTGLGVVLGILPGTVTITGSYGGFTATTSVTALL